MANEIKCGLMKNATRCKKCSGVNIELEYDKNGYYVKCEDCGYYVAGNNAGDAVRNWNVEMSYWS